MLGLIFAVLVLGALAGKPPFFPGQADLVTSLPGLASMPTDFNVYAGYLTIDQTTGKNFFYVLVEAANNRSTVAPLVRWLNGGPGCSSMGGFLEENGPWRPRNNGTVMLRNPQSWNLKANMLYIDSPTAVGWSFSKTPSDYSSSDATTAQDNYDAMQAFLDKFPMYIGSDLYIMGESYAGHYIPGMLSLLLDNPLPFNLLGVGIGNPTTHIADDFFYGTWRTWWAYGLISEPTWRGIEANCANTSFLQPPDSCQNWITIANAEIGPDINPYDLAIDTCVLPETLRVRTMQWKVLGLESPPYLPLNICEDAEVAAYMNRPDVQAALNVIPNATGLPWSDCTADPRFNYDYSGFYISQLPVYERALAVPSFKIIIYSGMADTVVPYLGTQRWVWDLFTQVSNTTQLWARINDVSRLDVGQNSSNTTLAPSEPWHTWHIDTHDGRQTAGWTVEWSVPSGATFRFITIRNAGHLVPWTSPIAASSVLEYMLTDTPNER